MSLTNTQIAIVRSIIIFAFVTALGTIAYCIHTADKVHREILDGINEHSKVLTPLELKAALKSESPFVMQEVKTKLMEGEPITGYILAAARNKEAGKKTADEQLAALNQQ